MSNKIIIPSPLITRMSRDYRAGHDDGFAEGVVFGKATYELALEKSKDKILEKIKSQLWIEIERDKDGVATEKALKEMTNKLPIVVVTQFNEHGIDQFFDVITRNATDCMQFIAANPNVTHYLELPKLNKES